MRIIVCGAGMVGFAIARQLASEENDVVVIDQTQQLVDRVMDSLDVQAVVGFASHPDVLAEAGASDADMLIAVTHSDEVNMVACQVCHSLFEIPLKIARIRSAKYLDPAFKDLFSRESVPIDEIISPEREVAETIVSRIQQPGAFDVSDFLDGDVQVAGIHILDNCPVIKTPIAQIHELFDELSFVVLALVRENRLRTCSKNDQLFPGDDIYILYRAHQRERVFSIFGHEEGQARRIVIVGAGNVGLTAAQRLEEDNSNLRITLIERDERRAETASEVLSKALVLKGDSLSPDILQESGVAQVDVFAALTNDDKVNILSALVAKRMGASQTMALVNEDSYRGMVGPVGVDTFINPRTTTVSRILQHIRRGRIREVRSLHDGNAEILEGEVLDTTVFAGRQISEVELPSNVIIGAVRHGDEVYLAGDDHEIEAGDHIVLLATADAVRKVEKLFRVSVNYF